MIEETLKVQLGVAKAQASIQREEDQAVFGLADLIRERAYQLYCESGRIEGRDVENWTQAERELNAELFEIIGTIVVND